MNYFKISEKKVLLRELDTINEQLKHYINSNSTGSFVIRVTELRSNREAVITSIINLLSKEVETFNETKGGF